MPCLPANKPFRLVRVSEFASQLGRSEIFRAKYLAARGFGCEGWRESRQFGGSRGANHFAREDDLEFSAASRMGRSKQQEVNNNMKTKKTKGSFWPQRNSHILGLTTGERPSFGCARRASEKLKRSMTSGQSFSRVMPNSTGQQLATNEQEQTSCRATKTTATRRTYFSKNHNTLQRLFQLMLVNIALSQLNYITQPQQEIFGLAPRILFAEAVECTLDGDCGNREKICHENKCICARDRPIEDQDRCLSLSLINEQCALSEQCLGNSLCVDGICSCGSDAISLYNPSSKIFYCHPKRRLNEECNYDSQCPSNSYCSTNKYGCICQNGFSAATVNYLGVDSLECLPKSCNNSSSCESEFHICDDEKCKCLATHFDPTTGKCYKFGSTGGKPLEDLLDGDQNGNNNRTQKASAESDDKFYSIVKDLIENGDRMWLVLIILITLSILILALIFMLVRRHYLGYCWTAHKKEYEPNNKNQPKNNNYFNKNSINNKSFRQKNGEIENDQDDSAEDRSNLVATSTKKNGNSSRAPFMTTKQVDNDDDYVKVNINENRQNTDDYSSSNKKQNLYNHHQIDPLASSTSTPV